MVMGVTYLTIQPELLVYKENPQNNDTKYH